MSGPFSSMLPLSGARADPDTSHDWRPAAALVPRAPHRMKRPPCRGVLVARHAPVLTCLTPLTCATGEASGTRNSLLGGDLGPLDPGTAILQFP